ncbi:inheritance of peroxisomes protein 1-domain-containing protein [Xylogone sp. PMI_703]|nr:inheritance of peroxisomes protein 1-domain-containing protein [Xylogone sp. PMI_703]
MASISPSHTPRQPVSRSMTRPESLSDQQVEILCILPAARIISFTTSSPASGSSSVKDSPEREPEPGSLSWTSRFERTIAVGPLRIYKAPGSVAFLSCNSALRPILPKSQCWCVNESSSRFILQIRRPQYWRIEIPDQGADDCIRSEQLKVVLQRILLFEKTPCPFRRTFTIELPAPPETPVRKRPWRPVARVVSEPAVEQQTERVANDNSPTPGRKQVLDCAENTSISHLLPPISQLAASRSDTDSQDCRSNSISVNVPPAIGTIYSSPTAQAEEDRVSIGERGDTTSAIDLTPRNRIQRLPQNVLFAGDLSNNTQYEQDDCPPIATVPILSLITSSPVREKVESRPNIPGNTDRDSLFSSSVDSFHSTISWQTPLPPPSPPASTPSSPTMAYPYPHNDIILSKQDYHNRDTSERTVTPSSSRVWDIRSTRSTGSLRSLYTQAASVDNELPRITRVPEQERTLRHRAMTITNPQRRALSPLPAAVNLFSPPPRARHLQTARHLPTAIVQKTCEILLSPPSHLFQLMIRVASRIAAGEWRGFLSGPGEAFHWDISEDEYGEDEWSEDDFGVKISAPLASEYGSVIYSSGGSWEVD